MLAFASWLGLLTAAALCFPRRPRLSGLLFLALGVWSVLLRFTTLGSTQPGSLLVALGSGVVWFWIGIMFLVRFHDSAARSAHVKSWTSRTT